MKLEIKRSGYYVSDLVPALIRNKEGDNISVSGTTTLIEITAKVGNVLTLSELPEDLIKTDIDWFAQSLDPSDYNVGDPSYSGDYLVQDKITDFDFANKKITLINATDFDVGENICIYSPWANYEFIGDQTSSGIITKSGAGWRSQYVSAGSSWYDEANSRYVLLVNGLSNTGYNTIGFAYSTDLENWTIGNSDAPIIDNNDHTNFAKLVFAMGNVVDLGNGRVAFAVTGFDAASYPFCHIIQMDKDCTNIVISDAVITGHKYGASGLTKYNNKYTICACNRDSANIYEWIAEMWHSDSLTTGYSKVCDIFTTQYNNNDSHFLEGHSDGFCPFVEDGKLYCWISGTQRYTISAIKGNRVMGLIGYDNNTNSWASVNDFAPEIIFPMYFYNIASEDYGWAGGHLGSTISFVKKNGECYFFCCFTQYASSYQIAALKLVRSEVKESIIVNIDERTVMSHRLLGEDVVNATFESKSALDIAIKDYIEHDGKTYTINNLPQVKKLSSLNYEYTAVFESLQYQLLKTQYLSSGLSEFDLVGDADDFMDLIITNLNRVDSGWTKGTVKSTDAIHLSFREETCLAVIQRLAFEFECEFELSTKEIKLTDIGSDTGLSFSYGKNKGLYDLTRLTVSSKNIITRLYAYGSERNLDKDYRTYSKRLMFAAAGSNYVENNVATYGLIEAVMIFEEVYPHREGTISYVDAGDVKVFRDSGIDFDVNSYLIEGVSAKIHFNTGNLAGFEFELTSYEHGDKQFTLLKNSNIQDYELPNSTLKPAIGDKYVILDITMPAAYITTAEADLTTKATDLINENSDPRVNYLLTPDPKYFKDNAINLKVGDKVTIVDSELSIDKLVRIIRLTQSLYNTYKYTLEFSDHLETQTILRIIAEQKEVGRKIIISDVGDIQKARRNWRSTAELQNIIFDPDDYFDTGNIRPLSIETSMLTVGNKSQQFFLKDVIMQPNYTGDAAKYEVSAGSLVHFTIDATIKVWTLSSNSYNSLVAGTVYYIYARCNRVGTAGQIILDTTQRKIDDGSTYYYFLIGVLHSVSDSVRCISLTYGFTRINGKFITTGEIKSQDGLTKFNLDTGVITGKITFISGTTGYGNIGDKPTSLNDISTAEFDAYEAKIKTFIQSAAPTAENLGDLWHDTDDDILYRWSGSAWVEVSTINNVFAQDAEPGAGMVTGDIWFDTNDKNKIYRYSGSAWVAVRDTDISQAIADAAAAQATADGKVVTFYQTTAPTAEGVGDLWVDTDDGNLLYRWSGSVWVAVQDDDIAQAIADAANAQNTADGKIVTFYQDGIPTSTDVGDLWVDTNDKNKLYRAACIGANEIKAGEWEVCRDTDIAQAITDAATAQSTADGKIVCFYQDAAPTAEGTGDLWVDTDDGNKLYRWNGAIWVEVQDDDISQAIADAATAQATADGKVTTFFQSATPTPEGVGDMWYDTDDGIIYRWNGATWEETADTTQTVIDGGLITSGRIELGSGGTIRAGINGYGTSGSEIRLWAGSTYANRATAPFRVNQDGEIFSTKGTIGGWTLATDALFTGTKHIADGFSTTGVTIASNGSIHAPNFYVNGITPFATGFKQIEEATFKADGDSQGIKIQGHHIWENELNADSFLAFNYYGYNKGFTQFRTLNIYDGKGNQILSVGNAGIKTWKSLTINRGINGAVNNVTSGETITADDYITICNNTGAITIYLPASPANGEMHIVKRGNSGAVTLNGNGKNMFFDVNLTSHSLAGGKAYKLIYSTTYGKWAVIGEYDA